MKKDKLKRGVVVRCIDAYSSSRKHVLIGVINKLSYDEKEVNVEIDNTRLWYKISEVSLLR